MTKRWLIALSLLLSFSTSFGVVPDNPRFIYGRITSEDLDLKSSDFPGAPGAVVEYDTGQSGFNINNHETGFDLSFKRKTRIKIFNKAGYDYSEIEIPLYTDGNDIEQIVNLEAYTYNFENGEVIKTPLNLNNVYEEKVNQYWVNKKFAMPNVKDGSIIEYKYSIISPFTFNLRDWNFQRRIPTLSSAYSVAMIPFYEYVYVLQSPKKPDIMESHEEQSISRRFGVTEYHNMIHRFVMKNVPAYDDEEYITSEEDHIRKIDFQLSCIHYPNGSSMDVVRTWPALIKELVKHHDFGKYIKSGRAYLKKNFPEKAVNGKSEDEKLAYAVDYVKKNYSWNGMYGKYAEKSLKDFTRERTGNIGNLNLFLTALLQQIGMDAEPVILSTRSNGQIHSQYPMLQGFNYVATLVKVGDKQVLADASEPYCPFDLLPDRCLSNKGLVVKEDAQKWVNLRSYAPSSTINNIRIEFTPHLDSVQAKIKRKSTQYDAFRLRKAYKKSPDNLTEPFRDHGMTMLDSMITKNMDNAAERVGMQVEVQSPVEIIKDRIYLAPFLYLPVSENPFKQNSRTYPVDITYAKTRTFVATITIPDGYSLQSLPDEYTVDNKSIHINYKGVHAGNMVVITGTYSLKKPVYAASDYGNLQFYFTQIIKKFNQKLVFVKSDGLTKS
jgi:hypothetical protein